MTKTQQQLQETLHIQRMGTAETAVTTGPLRTPWPKHLPIKTPCADKVTDREPWLSNQRVPMAKAEGEANEGENADMENVPNCREQAPLTWQIRPTRTDVPSGECVYPFMQPRKEDDQGACPEVTESSKRTD